MPRTVNEAAHTRRREAFLDAAQQLIEHKGYEQMSIQDVLDAAGTSRGALYHYFGSKQELLSGVVDRFGQAVASVLEPIVADPDLSALDKLRAVFIELTVREGDELEALVRTLRVWYSDDNARVRQKARLGIIDRLTGLLRTIVAQGMHEGAFEMSDPDLTGRLLATLILDLNDDVADRFASDSHAVDLATVERTVGAYLASTMWSRQSSGASPRLAGGPRRDVAAVHVVQEQRPYPPPSRPRWSDAQYGLDRVQRTRELIGRMPADRQLHKGIVVARLPRDHLTQQPRRLVMSADRPTAATPDPPPTAGSSRLARTRHRWRGRPHR